MKIGEKIEKFGSEIQRGRIFGKFSEKGQVSSEVCFLFTGVELFALTCENSSIYKTEILEESF